MSDERKVGMKESMKYSYDGVPTIEKFASSDAFVRCLLGPIASGKTSGCIAEIIKRIADQKPFNGIKKSRWAVIDHNYESLVRGTIPSFLTWLPPHIYGDFSPADGIYTLNKFDGIEAQIFFMSQKQAQESLFYSMELTGAYFLNAKDISFDIINYAMARVGRYPPMRDGGTNYYGIIMESLHPERKRNRKERCYLTKAMEQKFQGWEFFIQPSGLSAEAENTANLPQGYYEMIALGKDSDYIDTYIHGR